MPSIALYYPWMHFQDDNWLRLALLTWDYLARVRPNVMEDRDGDLVRQLRAETDFIVETAPSPTVLHIVAESFGEIFDAAPALLLDQYGLTEPVATPLGYGQVRLAGWRGYEPP